MAINKEARYIPIRWVFWVLPKNQRTNNYGMRIKHIRIDVNRSEIIRELSSWL